MFRDTQYDSRVGAACARLSVNKDYLVYQYGRSPKAKHCEQSTRGVHVTQDGNKHLDGEIGIILRTIGLQEGWMKHEHDGFGASLCHCLSAISCSKEAVDL